MNDQHKIVLGYAVLVMGLTSIHASILAQSSDITSNRVRGDNRTTAISASTSFRYAALAGDARLERSITIERRASTIGLFLQALTRMSGVKVRTDDPELYNAPLTVSFRATPLKNVLSGIAVLYDLDWQKTEKDDLVLVSRRDKGNLNQPRSDREKERFEAGKHFVDEASKLPEATQQLLADRYRAKFGDLPPSMQDSARRMLASRIQELQGEGRGSPVTLDDLTNASLRLEANRQSDGSHYVLSIGGPRGSIGLSFNDSVPGAENQDNGNSGRESGSANAAQNEQSSEDDPRFTQPITFHGSGLTVSEALIRLTEKAPIDFVTEGNKTCPERISFTFERKPVKEIIRQLAARYKNTEWIFRQGIVVVRGPLNASRNHRK